MRPFFSVPFTILCLALAFPLLAADPETEPGGKKLTDKELLAAKKAVDDYLGKIKGTAGQVEPIKDEFVLRAMPNYAFYTVRYRQFPVAHMTPKGLKASNVFAVGREGKVEILTIAPELEKFLKAKLPAASSDDRIKDAARLALRLAQEFHQDGFFRFKEQEDALKVHKAKEGKSASAKAVVMAGGNGTYQVDLRFTDSGKVSSLMEKVAIRSGPRPICQATKLLDKDPIVRGMAVQALLSMGRPCKDYLDEQRGKASPELKKAIDAMWKKILDQDP